jgi:ubiquinone/menaquinone biosynthesis C-methylase UbiE
MMMSKTMTDLFWNERPKTQVDVKKVNIDDLVQRDLEKDFIMKHLKPSDKILEVGCGNGFFTTFLREHVEWVDAFDYAENMITQAKLIYGEKNNKFFHNNLLEPKNIDQQYDVVVCIRVLINLRDVVEQKLAVSKMLSWVKPGGKLLLIEGFKEGFDNLNNLRVSAKIEPLKPAAINFYSHKEEILASVPGDYSIVDHFHTGMFDFLTRVVYSALEGADMTQGPGKFHEKIKEIPKVFNPGCMEPFARLHGWAFTRAQS